MKILNLNSYVWVKLTPAGISVLNRYIKNAANRLLTTAGDENRQRFVANVTSWYKPEEGWYRFPMSSFMLCFGSQLKNKSMLTLAKDIDSSVGGDLDEKDTPLFEGDEIHLIKPF